MAYVPKACGFILFREGPGRLETLLLTGQKHGAPGVPKGHVEAGETELETALRETWEETGLSLISPDPFFRTELHYPAKKKGRVWDKTVVLFLARTGGEGVVLSKEHSAYAWLGLADALARVPFANLRGAIREAALYVKDPALFELESATETQAEQYVEALEHTDARLMAHLRGTARLARTFARALAKADKPVDQEATAVGAWLHDVGRALGCHEDHQLAGIEHLAGTELEAYRFACISHFTKGATDRELLEAGLLPETLQAFHKHIDLSTLTWEEHCVALADACMKGKDAVLPHLRFEDLRQRYPEAHDLLALQERRTEAIRRTIEASILQDPLTLVELQS